MHENVSFQEGVLVDEGPTSVGGAPGLVRKVLGKEVEVKVEAEEEERQESVANKLKKTKKPHP